MAIVLALAFAGCSVDLGKLRAPAGRDSSVPGSPDSGPDLSVPALDARSIEYSAIDTAKAIEAMAFEVKPAVPEGGREGDSSTEGGVSVSDAAFDGVPDQEDGPIVDRPPILAPDDAGPINISDASPATDSAVDAPADGLGVDDAARDGNAGGRDGGAGDTTSTGGIGGIGGAGGTGGTAGDPDAGTPGPACISIASSSPRHYYPAAAYDPTLQKAVLFGGHTNCSENQATNQTWEWDGSAWARMNPTLQTPSPRGSIVMAFDRVRGEALFHGGWTQPNMVLTGTYGYDLGTHTWTSHGGNLLSLEWYAMDYDTDAGLVRMFGGADVGAFYRSVRSWSATSQTWQTVTATSAPVARARHAWAFDQEHHLFVMFGGVSNWAGTYLADTWEYDPATNTWQQTATSGVRPTECDIPAPMAYDPVRRLVVMYCYQNGGEIWEYDAGAHAWAKALGSSSVGAIVGATMFYDEKLQSVLLVGGCKSGTLQDRTWQYIP